jgi:hypothetical protein
MMNGVQVSSCMISTVYFSRAKILFLINPRNETISISKVNRRGF